MDSEIVCVGGANIDIKAKSDVPVIAGSSNPGSVTMTAGGVARNIAQSLAQLGLKAALIAAIGADAGGDDLVARSAAAGIDVSMVKRYPKPTGSYLAVLDAGGELVVAVNAMNIADALVPEALEPHAARLRRASHLVADCNLPEASLAWLCRLGPDLIIEPVSAAKAMKLKRIDLAGIYAVTPNRIQTEQLVGETIEGPVDAVFAAKRLQAMGFRNIMMPLGPQGVVAAAEGKPPVHIQSFDAPGEVVDVVGAGDGATAGFLLGRAEGRDFVSACHWGQAAAAIVVRARESVPAALTREAVTRLVAQRQGIAAG